MNSVFSNYLLNRVSFRRDPSKSFEELLITTTDLCEPIVLLMGGGYDVNLDRYAKHEDVKKLIKWISENILKHCHKDSYVTRGVKLRIATGMLNKIDIPKDVKIHYHDNMVRNVYNLVADIYELPF